MKLLIKLCLTILIFISAINFLYAQVQPAPRGEGSISGVLILIIIIGLIIFLSSKKLKKKHVDVVEGKKKELTEQGYKIGGIILTVIGGAIGVWVFTRLTSLAGKLHSWEPPFTEYETTTIIGGGIAVLFIIAGLIYLTKKQQSLQEYKETRERYDKLSNHAVEKVDHTEKGGSVEKVEEKTEVKTAKEIEEEKEAVAKREAELDKERREKADKDFLKY